MKTKAKKGKVAPLKPLTDAQRQLVEKHISFAMNLGTRYAGLGDYVGVPKEDLQQEACYGLCIAAQRFDARRDADFQTFANGWCVKFIMLAINGQDPGMYLEDEDVQVADEEYQEDSAQELAAAKVQKMLGILNEKQRQVICMIYGLSYGRNLKNPEPMGFAEVAKKLHVSPSRVHQIYEDAMGKMEISANGRK